MRKVVFDIETKNTFAEINSTDPTAFDISVVAIYDSETNDYSVFEEHEFSKLWSILEKTDLLIGFNSDHFDIPILNKYYPGDLTVIKSLDILKEIKAQYGRRMKLDQLADGTLGMSKSGNGLDAIKWWRNGEKDKVKKYCIDDVKITKELYDYAIKNGSLKFKEGGTVQEVKLKTSHWEEIPHASMTHTLPF